MVKEANFIYLIDLVNPYLPDAMNTSKEETVRLIITHASNGQYNPMPASSTLNGFAATGISRSAAKKILKFIDKETSSLEEYFRKIGADQLTMIANKLKNDSISTDVYRGKVPALLAKLFYDEFEKVSNRKNKRKQKKPTEDSGPGTTTNIELTIKDEKGIFDEALSQIKEIELPYQSSGVKAFALLPVNGIYSHKKLISLLRKNLARYIFSRRSRAESDDLEELTAEATTELRNFLRECNPQTLLGELLTYIFLEHCEKAPKIFTKAEFYQKYKSIKQRSVFFRETNSGWQLIIGASNLNETLDVAIEGALRECEDLKNESDFGGGPYSTQIFQGDILDASFTPEQIRALESIVFPSSNKDGSIIKIDSYGIFLGYQIDDTQDDLEKQLKSDAERAVETINNSISNYGLDKHPIYMYLLPFKKLAYESNQIIDKLVGK